MNSIAVQFKSNNNLLAEYDTDTSSLTKKLSEQKAAADNNIIRSEQCRLMYINIPNVVKPTASKGLQKLMIRRHKEQSEYPTDFQNVLATTDPEEIIWDTVLDKETIKGNLL